MKKTLSNQFSEVEEIFHGVRKAIEKESWFKKGKWVLSTHPFPAKKPDAITLHASKPHWFNDDKMGIHVETFLALDPKKRKKSYVTIHISHHEVLPGTKSKRMTISKPIVDAIYEEVSGWDGYKFRAGKYGLQPFTFVVDGTSENFQKIVVQEFARICKFVGPHIDRVLSSIKL